MKVFEARWWAETTARREIYAVQREIAMTNYRGLAVIAVASLLCLAGCGSGGGDGAEDTGSLVTITQQSGATQTVNVDVVGDALTDAKLSLTFKNESVVPEGATATTLVLYECTVSYTSKDPVAPPLDPADCSLALTVAPDSSVDADVVLVPLGTIGQFVGTPASLPDHPVEYDARYTFKFRNTPFDQGQTVDSSSIRFSMADFVSTTP